MELGYEKVLDSRLTTMFSINKTLIDVAPEKKKKKVRE